MNIVPSRPAVRRRPRRVRRRVLGATALVVAAAVGCVPCPHPVSGTPTTTTPTPTTVWVGDWSGPVTDEGEGPYDVSLHITSVTDPGGVAGTGHYTVFGCSFELTVVSATAQTLRLHEHLTVPGVLPCIPEGDVTMTLTGPGRADWTYLGDVNVTATALLTRA